MQWRSAVQVKPQMYGVTWVIGDICLTFCQQHKTFLRVCKKKCHSCGINYFFVIVYENHATWVARYWNLWAFVCKDTKAPIWHIRGLLRQKTKAAHQSALGNSMPLRPEHSLPSASICVNYGCVLGGLMYHVCIHRKKKKKNNFNTSSGRQREEEQKSVMQVPVLWVSLVNIVPPNFWHIPSLFLANVLDSNSVWLRTHSHPACRGRGKLLPCVNPFLSQKHKMAWSDKIGIQRKMHFCHEAHRQHVLDLRVTHSLLSLNSLLSHSKCRLFTQWLLIKGD